MIAALFVAKDGTYFGLPDVDPWDEAKDARAYAGPFPVVAHPPCERWGRYWHGGPTAKVRKVKGDDGGRFAAALSAVRQWGGVLEHPEASAAWHAHGILTPPKAGGWLVAGDRFPAWTCCVEQGHYGHRARKATWLYVCGRRYPPPQLHWGPSPQRVRLDDGYHSADERRARKHTGQELGQRLTKRECSATPIPFRDLLLGLARGCVGRAEAA